jgi:TRAP-type C4-dicarboxylate transport system substrate-binding protein
VFSFSFTTIQPLVLAGDVIEIKAATWHPMGHRLTTDSFKVYGKEIEKRTNGKVKFKWFLAGSLVKPAQGMKAVKSGLVDLMLPIPVWAMPSLLPISSGIDLPFLADSSKHASRTFCRMYETIPEMQKELSGFKPLGFWTTAITNWAVKGDPPKNLKDLKGLRLCTPSPNVLKRFELLGVTPVHIKLPDMYMAMSRGMADGCEFPDAPLRSYKFIDFLNGHTMMNVAVGGHITAMNPAKWNSLPPDVQKVFEDMIVPGSMLNGVTLTNEALWVIAELKKRGDKFYYLPPGEKAIWKDKLQPQYADFVARLNAKAMDGNAILEKVKAAADWARKNPYADEDWWGRAGRK